MSNQYEENIRNYIESRILQIIKDIDFEEMIIDICRNLLSDTDIENALIEVLQNKVSEEIDNFDMDGFIEELIDEEVF